MSQKHANPAEAAVADYLKRLRRASTDLPDGPRAELLDNISTHLADTSAENSSEAHVRTVLDQLGTPEEVAEAARAESGTHPARTQGERLYDGATVAIVVLAGFVLPVLGWIVGVVMLWRGPRWHQGQKWLGTLLWPLMFAMAGVMILTGSSPVGDLVLVAGVALVLLGLPAAAIYLTRAAARHRS